MTLVRQKDRDALLLSLRSGVVPRAGQHLIQVGRGKEIEALMKDIARIADGGACFRLIVGEFGSGKSFFLNLIRSIAMQEKLVTATADLNPDRRLHGTGTARSLYAELTRNIATRAKPDGGALSGIVEKFIATAEAEAKATGLGTDTVIQARLERLQGMVLGYDFAHVIEAYWKGHKQGDQNLQSDAIRWLRGEFSTKTDVRNALGIRTIVDDANFYDQLKLLGVFFRLAGHGGLMICLDEMVNIYRLNSQARSSNYEQILRILNDTLQNNCEGLGFLLGGTPEFLMDTRRGLYSYSALQSRLAENTFAKSTGLTDYNHPVLRLSSLTPEEFLVLLGKILDVFAYGDPAKRLLPDEALVAFIQHCLQRIGEAYFRTPRTTITSFVNLLSILEQNPSCDWRDMIGQVEVKKDTGDGNGLAMEDADAGSMSGANDEFADFKL
jgi:hypothetical protein